MRNMKRYIASIMLILLGAVAMTACGVIEVRGKTFVYESVSIDWGRAEDEQKEAIFEEFLVSNETELLNVLRTRNQRNSRVTTFGTDGKYITRNLDGEILDEGYYKQDDEIITLAESQDGFTDAGNYTLKANERGYTTNDKLNDEYGIFAIYQYVLDD